MSKSHPANRGLVMLTAWVDPVLRDHVRARASDRGEPLSAYVAEALRRRGVDDDVARIMALDPKEPAR